ncbi:hypothetical protein DRW41_16735 [Neobacillus piezotolerans]|uniref:Uncharacterized protein n=1 Tax=Neobacillus piezotolerans TaxID=2259171 RepID=A0A3D8GMS4_9BACI|nr:hypothetical protein [Neobacillus piezotolerans]RDU35780.1 hypothetical protein DRW41_16735 [Neobacillus piezotolerans]
MLTFEEKLEIFESFPELERKDVSLGRVNFQFPGSVTDKKNVVYHLHPNGNGFVYAGGVDGYETDEKGLVNIRDFTADELKELTARSIADLSGTGMKEAPANAVQNGPEKWVNKTNDVLIVIHEDDLWNVYYGVNLEESFGAYGEVEEYMAEEGFSRRK